MIGRRSWFLWVIMESSVLGLGTMLLKMQALTWRRALGTIKGLCRDAASRQLNLLQKKGNHWTGTAQPTGGMFAMRPAWVACALPLILLIFCRSAIACQIRWNPDPPPRPGYVTGYVPPMANLTLDRLVGRWYFAEAVIWEYALETRDDDVCFILDFHHNDNGTLVVKQLKQSEGILQSANYTMPVSENGTWDEIIEGLPYVSWEVVDLSDDNRYLVTAECLLGTTDVCFTFVLVRHFEDAGRHDELTEVHRRLARAGIRWADCGFVKDLQPCRPNATRSRNTTGWRAVNYTLSTVDSN